MFGSVLGRYFKSSANQGPLVQGSLRASTKHGAIVGEMDTEGDVRTFLGAMLHRR